MEMVPSASFFETKDVFNGSTNRNSLCMDMSIFFPPNFRPFAVSAAEMRARAGWLLAGSSALFLLREQENTDSWESVLIPSSCSNPFISCPVPATSGRVQMSNSCPNQFLEKSQEREQQFYRVETFSLCSELPANTREPPGTGTG